VTRGMRSGQLAAAVGVNVQTLRYYERRGLLPGPRRSLGGHREYGPDAVAVLRIIRAAQRLGFTLTEIAELIEVGSHRGPRPGLRDRAQAKLAEVDAKIAALGEIRATLVEVIDAGCSDLATCSCSPACPIPFAALTAEGPYTCTRR
jgi:MerR family transcriptional regulator, mercuric resistance operon regulatory protein